MKVFTVEEPVDLGSHTHGVFTSRQAAATAILVETERRSDKIKARLGSDYQINKIDFFIEEFELDAQIYEEQK